MSKFNRFKNTITSTVKNAGKATGQAISNTGLVVNGKEVTAGKVVKGVVRFGSKLGKGFAAARAAMKEGDNS